MGQYGLFAFLGYQISVPEKQKVAQNGKIPGRSDPVRLDVVDNDQSPKGNGDPIDLVIGTYWGPSLLLSAMLDMTKKAL